MPNRPSPPAGDVAASRDEAQAHRIISLLFEVMQRGRLSFESAAASHGLNPMQARALMFLVAPTPMREVAQHLRCDPSYVTEIADELEDLGLIERQSVPSDRRVKNLVPTSQGESIRASLRTAFATTSPVMAKLSSSEREQLAELLEKMRGEQTEED